jgi:hypothetical protein
MEYSACRECWHESEHQHHGRHDHDPKRWVHEQCCCTGREKQLWYEGYYALWLQALLQQLKRLGGEQVPPAAWRQRHVAVGGR